MNRKEKDFMKNIIPISISYGVTLGNAVGMVLTTRGMSTGLLMGNAVGISLGLVVGTLYNHYQKRKDTLFEKERDS